MAINKIQFQKGLSLVDFLKDYGTELQCEEAVVGLRWPEGFVCPRCAHRRASAFRRSGLRYWQCAGCQHQSSLYAGTLLEHTRLPLTKWFLGFYLVSQSKTGIAALALRKHLGVSWRAAWLLKHKLMEAMFQRERGRTLQGDVAVDDAYLGGELTGGKAGRGSENKVPFLAAVELKYGAPQRVRFDRVDGFSRKALQAWGEKAVAPESWVTTDGLRCFEVFQQPGYRHTSVIAPKGKAGARIEPFRWLNTLLGNLKTSLAGTYHAFDYAKYGHRYLAESQYKFNRRYNLATLPLRIATAVVQLNPCPERVIRLALR